jgi:hypothetical protein
MLSRAKHAKAVLARLPRCAAMRGSQLYSADNNSAFVLNMPLGLTLHTRLNCEDLVKTENSY